MANSRDTTEERAVPHLPFFVIIVRNIIITRIFIIVIIIRICC